MTKPNRTIRDRILLPKRKASINSKVKGNLNERKVAKWLSAWTGKEFVRTPQSGGIRWQNSLGLNICGDVVCTEQHHHFPFTVENKHLKGISFDTNWDDYLRKNTRVLTIFKQVQRDSERDRRIPMLILRGNGMPENTWWVFLPMYIYLQVTSLGNVKRVNISKVYGRLIAGNSDIIGIHSNDLMMCSYGKLCDALD